MKLIITRHGQTVQNLNKICSGQGPGELSAEGIEQAKKLGLRLKDRHIDVAYSSDLSRAVDTANEIIAHHPHLELVKDIRIRERFLGKQQGVKFPDDWDWQNLPADAETDDSMCVRGREFLDDVYDRHKDQTVLVVCHGGMKMALLAVVTGKDFSSFEGMKNTSVSEFDILEDGHKVVCMNCVEHLG